MKKILIGLLAFSSISAYANLRSYDKIEANNSPSITITVTNLGDYGAECKVKLNEIAAKAKKAGKTLLIDDLECSYVGSSDGNSTYKGTVFFF